MSNKFMPEDQAIKQHLSLFKFHEADPPTLYFSGFTSALRDARKFTGRNPDNGQKLKEQNFGNLGSWLGAIGYMALLDQIGSCFKPKSSSIQIGNTIKKALKYFTTLSDPEIDAVYALRCAFAHDYSLYNIHSNPSLTHHFGVCQNPVTRFVTLPQEQWDGNYENKNDRNITTINLEALGDTIEQICAQLFELANKNELEVILIGGSDELLQRYSFCATNKKILLE
jgi:hypothetical protein